jgi:uncharacterized protein (DUF697 family)/predicted GTPase
MDIQSFNLSETISKAVMDTLKERGHVNILIAGKPGVGKSTLINAVFEGNLAETGIGRPVTTHTKEYSKEGVPLRLYDTRGLELKEYKEILNELEVFIKRTNNDTDPQNHIHVAWLCINEESRRVEKAETDLCEMLSRNNMPVIGIITSAISDNGFKNEVQKLLPSAKNVVRVNSIPKVLDEGLVIKPSGLTNVVEITMSVVPEAFRMAFVASQKVSVQQKIDRANEVVAIAAIAAGAAAANPIPFSDAVLLVPIQVGMLAKITGAFGLKVQEGFLSTLVSSTITGVGATIVGRTIVTNLLKFFPGVGTVLGGVIAGTTAAAVTAAFGKAYIAALSAIITNREDTSTITNEEIMEEFKKRYKDKN